VEEVIVVVPRRFAFYESFPVSGEETETGIARPKSVVGLIHVGCERLNSHTQLQMYQAILANPEDDF